MEALFSKKRIRWFSFVFFFKSETNWFLWNKVEIMVTCCLKGFFIATSRVLSSFGNSATYLLALSSNVLSHLLRTSKKWFVAALISQLVDSKCAHGGICFYFFLELVVFYFFLRHNGSFSSKTIDRD